MRIDFTYQKRVLSLATVLGLGITCSALGQPTLINAADYAHYAAKFNSLDADQAGTSISNAGAWKWMADNVPLFSCPDTQLEEIYYFRWWTFRKHIRHTPQGVVITEFLAPVKHAGPYNTISCAFGHHLAEGSWIRDRRPLDEYTQFWFRSGPGGVPAPHFHKYSSWAAAAVYDRYLITLDRKFAVDVLDDLVADYASWEMERQNHDGLFWQFDVADGMEESISGSRTQKNVRPTINSYMIANAQAIASIAKVAGRADVANRFTEKAEQLRTKMIAQLWDSKAEFFKVRREEGTLSDAREAIGLIPWMFGLTEPQHAVAWREVKDPAGFLAPCGLTTAERRHPDFRTHGTGTCEWDGAVWPFATSQTLNGLIRVLRGPEQPYVTRRDFLDALQTYARAHHKDGKPYIGEYYDEITGDWLITGRKAARSRDYNHSTFCDLVIRGLVGIVPRADDIVEINPLLPPDTWDWFCLDGVPYHGQSLTIVWDRTGGHYNRGAGLAVWADGHEVARVAQLARLTGKLPTISARH
jgi:Trehalase